jgi:hypothetical protein
VAASDVFPEEPLPLGHPVGGLPASCGRRTAPARSIRPSRRWARWCSRTWN